MSTLGYDGRSENQATASSLRQGAVGAPPSNSIVGLNDRLQAIAIRLGHLHGMLITANDKLNGTIPQPAKGGDQGKAVDANLGAVGYAYMIVLGIFERLEEIDAEVTRLNRIIGD